MRRLMSNGRVPKRSTPAPTHVIQEPITGERARTLILGHRAPDGMRVLGHLDLGGEHNIYHLPENLTCESLDISNCPNITTLPKGLHVTHWIEIAGSGITTLPAGHGFFLRWRGVHVSDRIAFASSLTGQEILRTDNVEIRRVLIERLGYETFLQQVGGVIRDSPQERLRQRDTDAGGERQLICIAFDDDEPLMLLKVICPSTRHLHVLRVPPYMDTCHQSAAWIAGFDNPDDYDPAIEA
jgi:hypothetical protein